MGRLRGMCLGLAVVGAVGVARVEGGYVRVIQNLEQLAEAGGFEWTGHNFGLPQIDQSGAVSVASISEEGYPPIHLASSRVYGVRTISAPGSYDWSVLNQRLRNHGEIPASNQYHEMDTLTVRHSVDGHSMFVGRKTNDVFEATGIHIHNAWGTAVAFKLPTVSGDRFERISGMVLSRSGHGIVGFETEKYVPDPFFHDGGLMYYNASGESALLAYSGMQAPGLPEGVVLQNPDNSVGRGGVKITSDGGGVFASGLFGEGTAYHGQFGIWSFESDGALDLVASVGTAMAGVEAGEEFRVDAALGSVSINDAGHLAFGGRVHDSATDELIYSGIWSDRSGVMERVVRSGDPAPGGPAGGTFAGALGTIINARGDIGFLSVIESPIRGEDIRGYWVAKSDSTIEAVYVPGLPIDGIDPSVDAGFHTLDTFVNVDDGIQSTNMAMNNVGQFAFRVDLNGPGILEDVNDVALLGRDSDGSLHKIIQTGDLVKWDLILTPGVVDETYLWPVVEIEFLGASGGEGGRGTALNDDGFLVFKVTLEDAGALGSTGRPEVILRSRIPGAGTAVVFGMAGAVGLRRRRAG